MQKYILTDCKKKLDAFTTVYRIKATRDFYLSDGTEIKSGTFGGFVQSEKNLSQKGTCWLKDDAMAYNSAVIRDSAVISGQAEVKDKAVVCGNALVMDDSVIKENAQINGSARIYNSAAIQGNAIVFGTIKDNGFIFGDAKVGRSVVVEGCACVGPSVILKGETVIGEKTFIKGRPRDAITIKNSIIKCKLSSNIASVFFEDYKQIPCYITIKSAKITLPGQVRIIPVRTYSSSETLLTICPNSWTLDNFYATDEEELLTKIAYSNVSPKNKEALSVYEYIDEKPSISQAVQNFAESLFNKIYEFSSKSEKNILDNRRYTVISWLNSYYWAQLLGLVKSLNSDAPNAIIDSIIDSADIDIKSKKVLGLSNNIFLYNNDLAEIISVICGFSPNRYNLTPVSKCS